MHIEEMPSDDDTTMFVPFFSTNVNSTPSRSSGIIPAAPIVSQAVDNDVAGPDYPSFLLYVEVESEEYEEVRSILKEQDCYMRE
jgi:hypothetical protein